MKIRTLNEKFLKICTLPTIPKIEYQVYLETKSTKYLRFLSIVLSLVAWFEYNT